MEALRLPASPFGWLGMYFRYIFFQSAFFFFDFESRSGKKIECGRGFSFNFRNPKCKLNTFPKFNSILQGRKCSTSGAWQFCDCDLFGMVSLRDLFKGCW